MLAPIAAHLVRRRSESHARSALPDAPVIPAPPEEATRQTVARRAQRRARQVLAETLRRSADRLAPSS
jgi:hypothetical protein